jgi:CHASE2 domain-containing sensor protein
VFQRVILDGKAESGMYSHLGEAGFTQLWWIRGAIFVTLTVVGIDNNKRASLIGCFLKKILLFYYSYVHTMLGSFLPAAPMVEVLLPSF